MANNEGNAPTKKERRELAREKARQLRELEEKRKKRNRWLMIGGLVVALALVVFAVFEILGNKPSADQGSYDGEVRAATLANVTDDYGITFDASGKATADAPETGRLGVYADYTCHGCQSFEDAYASVIKGLVGSGDLSYTMYPVATLNNQLSDNAAAAMFYIATYAPEQAWDYNAALFQLGEKTVRDGAPIPPESVYADAAAEVGVPDDVVQDLPASIASEDWKKVAVAATDSFRDKGHNATPTLEVNGEKDDSWLEDGGDPQNVIDKAVQSGK